MKIKFKRKQITLFTPGCHVCTIVVQNYIMQFYSVSSTDAGIGSATVSPVCTKSDRSLLQRDPMQWTTHVTVQVQPLWSTGPGAAFWVYMSSFGFRGPHVTV